MTLPSLTIIPAGAGSGKTYSIQTTLTKWVQKRDISPERIIAVTFTEAAANELRERIRFALLSDPKISMDQVLALDQAYITTIHGFGLRLLQEYCFEGGWSPLPRLLTEDEGDILIRQALAVTRKADAIMADLSRFGYHWDYYKGSAEDQFRSLLASLIQKHRIIGLEGVNKRIKKHLLQEIKRLYGRTESATNLEKRLLTAVKGLLRKFPDSLAELYPSNASYTRNMGSDYRNLLKARKKGALQRDWSLWVSLQTLRTSRRGSGQPDGYDDLVEEVMSAAQQLFLHPGPLDDAMIHADAIVNTAQDCLQQHTTLKRNKCLVDYGDMLSLAHELLVKNKDVLQDLSEKVDCVVIDEFQDTNPLQFSLLWALYRQGIPTLVVGDVKQAIMGFQDADSRLLEALEKSKLATSSPLKKNWRTVRPLMDFLNAAGQGLFPGSYQKLKTEVTGISKNKPLQIINFCEYPKSHSHMGDHFAVHIKSILEEKRQVLDNGRYRNVQGSDIAILLPTNKLIETYADSFRQAGLMVQVDECGWFESRCVQILYYALLFVADPDDRHAALYLAVTELGQSSLQDSVSELINGELLSDPVLKKLSALYKGHTSDDVYSQVQKAIAVLDLFTTVSTWPNAGQERANILRLLAEAQEFTSTNPETLEAGGLFGFGLKTFLAWLQKRQESDNNLPRVQMIDQEAIQFSTWHSAKGREWPIVAVCGTFKDYIAKLPSLDIQYLDFNNLDNILKKAVIEFSPAFDAKESNEFFLEPLQIEKEKNAKRLLYVAMTRAKEQLILERAGHQEEKDTLSYWNLLVDCTGMDITDKLVEIGRESFKSSQIVIGKEKARIEDNASTPLESGLPCLGIRAIKKQPMSSLTSATMRPSQIPKSKIDAGLKITTIRYGTPLNIDLKRDPAETGTILHRCFEVLSGQEDRTNLLENATGYTFSEKQKESLQVSVEAFETWCHETFGDIKMRKEIPITYQNEDGVVISGIIDLIIERKDGYWIIDHKTHKSDTPEKDFREYWPQLKAYQQGLEGGGDKKKVLGVAVHWLSDGAVSVGC